MNSSVEDQIAAFFAAGKKVKQIADGVTAATNKAPTEPGKGLGLGLGTTKASLRGGKVTAAQRKLK